MGYATWASRTAEDAVLIMESRGLAPQVRGFHFTDFWSRLYKTNEYFLDITCRPDDAQSRLTGQVMLSSGEDIQETASVRLYQGKELVAEVEVDSYGQFNFALEKQGEYELKVVVEAKMISVSPLRVN